MAPDNTPMGPDSTITALHGLTNLQGILAYETLALDQITKTDQYVEKQDTREVAAKSSKI